MYCIQIGNGARAMGIGCISIGDGIITRGAWQVHLGPTLDLSTFGSKPEDVAELMNVLQEMKLLYTAFSEQGFAPKDYAPKACSIIDYVITLLKKRLEDMTAKNKEEASETLPPVVEEVVEIVEVKEEETPRKSEGTKDITVKDVPRQNRKNRRKKN